MTVAALTVEGGLESGYLGLAYRIEAEFRRRPALSLTSAQLADWLGLDDAVSVRVLNALVNVSVLERGQDERYRLLVRH